MLDNWCIAMENKESKSKYDYFDVTADIGFYAYGNSLEEAYENAGLAMFNVITDISKVKKEESREFEIVSEDLVSLLYDYLEELLFLQDTEFLFFSDFKDCMVIFVVLTVLLLSILAVSAAPSPDMMAWV